MKMMKRTLCLVLALVMLVGMFTVGASATGVDGADPSSTTTKANFNFYGKDPSTSELVRIAYWTFDVTDSTTLDSAWEQRPAQFSVPKGYSLNTDKISYINGGNIDNWDVPLSGDVDLFAPLVELEKFNVTFYVDGNTFANLDAYKGEEIPVPQTVPTKDGYTFKGWADTADALFGEEKPTGEVKGNMEFHAVWEKNQTAPSEPTPEVPSSLLKTFPNAVKITCLKDHHEDAYYPLEIKSADQVTMLSDKKAMVELSSSDISAYIADYNDDVDGKHAYNVNARSTVAVVLEYKQGFYCFPGHWEVTAIAELPVTCDCMHCHDYCGGWFHKHTVTYTDGVKNATVFKDITYEVKHGAKTPVPADPVRAGYKFAGWTPAVSAKTTKCVTYTATWTAVKAPALTTKHVAYLKGYGGGIVKPEGEITRAEAITMLYRLMDAASVKEYYTSYNAFTDVAKDAWYNDAVSTLANAGVLRYKTGLLNPNEKITRAEFFYMLTKFSNATYTGKATFVDVPASYWAYEELALAQYLGWIKGYGGGILYPDDTITRAEVAASLNRVLGRTDCKTKDTKNYSDNPVNAWYYQDIVEASIAH